MFNAFFKLPDDSALTPPTFVIHTLLKILKNQINTSDGGLSMDSKVKNVMVLF